MRRMLSRIIALAGAVLSALLIVAPLMIATAAPSQVATGVLMQDEAWFFRARQPAESAPEVEDPSGNGVPGIAKATVRERTNPYQAETLHVGVVAGEPEAATFLSLPLFELTEDGMPPVVTGGKITLVDGGSSLGSKRADASEMIACLVTELFSQAQGGDWKDLPKYDCATKTTVALVEGSIPFKWTIDLAPFAAAWADPNQNYGVAIVNDPDSAKPKPEQGWHVAFQAQAWKAPDPSPTQTSAPPEKAPVRADVRFSPVVFEDYDDSGSSGNAGSSDSFGGSSYSPGSFGGGSSDADYSSGDELAPAVDDSEAVVDDGGEIAAPPPTAAEQRPVRTNPAVYLLPFLGLGLAGMLGYSLSHDPELPTEREGAVSKLMARRREQ